MKVWVKSFVRPWFGMLALQPLIFVYLFFVFPEDWWYHYMTQAGPLNILGTIWLIPAYHYYDHWWNMHQHLVEPET